MNHPQGGVGVLWRQWRTRSGSWRQQPFPSDSNHVATSDNMEDLSRQLLKQISSVEKAFEYNKHYTFFVMKLWIHTASVCFIVNAFASMVLLTKTTFSPLPWKLGTMGSIWFHQKNCNSISFQCMGELPGQWHSSRARNSLKICNSRFSGYHGNIFRILWILVNRLPKAHLSAKFQVSSPNGHAVKMWVTYSVTERSVLHR